MCERALEAAEKLAGEGIDAEVIDLRTIRPFDAATIVESVKKTNRIVSVEEGWPFAGIGSEIAAVVMEQAFDWLDAPIARVTAKDVPLPYAANLEALVNFQMNSVWGIVWQPLGFLIFFTTAYAETDRLPFDLTEAEAELVAGYHTEYSSLKFGMYYLGEYCNMLTASFMVTILFLGGWHVPFLGSLNVDPFVKQLIQVGAMAFKVAFLMFTYVWVRWTLPRFRYDQLMNLGWKKLIPLALANVVITAVVMAF